MMEALRHHPNLSPSDRSAAVEQIRQWRTKDAAVKELFEATAVEYAQREPAGNALPYPWQKGLGPTCFDIEASATGVAEADAAAVLIENFSVAERVLSPYRVESP